MTSIAAVLGVGLALAAPAAPAAAETGWELEVSSAPNGPIAPPDSPNAPEWERIWDNLQRNAFNDLCRSIQIPASKSLVPADFVTVGLGAQRNLATYADRKLAIVDRATLAVSLGESRPISPPSFPVPLSVWFGGRAEGDAYVIRPLNDVSACRELKVLFNPLTYRTVIPTTVQRLSTMQIGEIWKLPMVWSVGASVGASYGYAPASLTLSVGYSRQDAATLTVVRLSTETLRLIVRLDQATFFDKGASLGASVPIAELLGLDGALKFPLNEGQKVLVRELNRYLSDSLGLDLWDHQGRKFLLEFDLNPSDQKQMQHLAAFLKGNISAFGVLRRTITLLARRPEQVRSQLADIQRRNASILGLSRSMEQNGFAGADDYERKGWRPHAQVPVVGRWQTESEYQSDSTVVTGEDYTTVIRQKSRRPSIAWVDVPLLGQMYKGNSERTVQTMARVDRTGEVGAPFLQFLHQEAFLRHRQRSARAMVESANEILKYAGAQRDGDSGVLLLPQETMFPKEDETNPLYHSAISAFTLAFNEQALSDILWSPAERIVQAFANVLPEKERKWLEIGLKHGRVLEDGTLVLDRKSLWNEVVNSVDDRDDDPLVDRIAKLASRAAGMVKDLVECRVKDWRKSSDRLVDVLSGGGRSGLEYDDAMKVLVQLVHRSDLFGEFRMQTNKKIKGATDVSGRYLLHWRQKSPEYLEEIKIKNKFADPSLLGY